MKYLARSLFDRSQTVRATGYRTFQTVVAGGSCSVKQSRLPNTAPLHSVHRAQQGCEAMLVLLACTTENARPNVHTPTIQIVALASVGCIAVARLVLGPAVHRDLQARRMADMARAAPAFRPMRPWQ
jgi:hypothetical protein